MRQRQPIEPEADTITHEEAREQAAAAIADALEYLHREAEAAGLDDVGARIRRAQLRARRRSVLPAADFHALCRKIERLPEDCRAALVLRKVYRRSCKEIADERGISVAAAKARIIEGFRLLLAAPPLAKGQEAVEALVQR